MKCLVNFIGGVYVVLVDGKYLLVYDFFWVSVYVEVLDFDVIDVEKVYVVVLVVFL